MKADHWRVCTAPDPYRRPVSTSLQPPSRRRAYILARILCSQNADGRGHVGALPCCKPPLQSRERKEHMSQSGAGSEPGFGYFQVRVTKLSLSRSAAAFRKTACVLTSICCSQNAHARGSGALPRAKRVCRTFLRVCGMNFMRACAIDLDGSV